MLKLFISIISIILTYGYSITLYQYASIDFSVPRVQYFYMGMLAFIPFWFFWLKHNTFYSTFEHEWTHLIVGLLFLKKPAYFNVTGDKGGETGLYGMNFVILLAPYFLPTFTIFLIPLYIIISEKYLLYYFALLGFVTSYHILSTVDEFGYYQPDIYTSGKIFSTIFLIFSNLLVYGFILMFVNGGFSLGGDFLIQGVIEIIKIIQ